MLTAIIIVLMLSEYNTNFHDGFQPTVIFVFYFRKEMEISGRIILDASSPIYVANNFVMANSLNHIIDQVINFGFSGLTAHHRVRGERQDTNTYGRSMTLQWRCLPFVPTRTRSSQPAELPRPFQKTVCKPF